MSARKQILPSDQNEPAKPLSAYALFFRDTVSAIKKQYPACSFQELFIIVASMWDALDPVHKSVYNKNNEYARTEYLRQVKIYQQQQQQKQEQIDQSNPNIDLKNTESTKHVSSLQQIITQQVMESTDTTNNQPQQFQHNQQVTNSNSSKVNITNETTGSSASSAATSNDQIRLITEAGSVQKCTRENCNKRAIINPDWEDEYCSNECVVIHCRNVFNAWVQSNLEAKQQQQQQQQPQPTSQQTSS